MVNILTRIALVIAAVCAVTPAAPAHADDLRYAPQPVHRAAPSARIETWVEDWDPFVRRWVRAGEPGRDSLSAAVIQAPAAPLRAFGPFVVIDSRTAAVMGTTNSDSPDDFKRMRAAFPQISALTFIDATGTINDLANLEVGRMIRAAGIATHVPAHGSVRSGAVELFLAGKQRTMEPGARFAVHAWRDERGRGPHDFAPEDPVNRLYTAYYEDMGMSAQDARAFYDMTNTAPHASALWFGPEVMRDWIKESAPMMQDTRPALLLACAPDLMFTPFAPLDDVGLMPTLRFARSHQAPLAAPEARWAWAGT